MDMEGFLLAAQAASLLKVRMWCIPRLSLEELEKTNLTFWVT